MITPRQMKKFYLQGENINLLLKKLQVTEQNTEEIIETSYDLQSGNYISGMKDKKMAIHKQEYASEIVQNILALFEPCSVLEAGVGEATTLAEVIKAFSGNHFIDFYGFDLCWSRIAYATSYLDKQVDVHASLCTGSLFEIPFLDSSIDIVYTSHSIEPNGGFEEPILPS